MTFFCLLCLSKPINFFNELCYMSSAHMFIYEKLFSSEYILLTCGFVLYPCRQQEKFFIQWGISYFLFAFKYYKKRRKQTSNKKAWHFQKQKKPSQMFLKQWLSYSTLHPELYKPFSAKNI